jgi:hypothetical protein
MKLSIIAAAILANLSAFAGAQTLDWNKDVASQAAAPHPTIYAFPRESDRFPYAQAGLKDGTVRAQLYSRLDPWTNRVGATLEVCDSSAISDMEPSPRCADLSFSFYKQLTVDLEKKTVSAGSEIVGILTDDGHGPELRWTHGHGVDYRIDGDGNIEVFLKRAP